MPLLDTFFGSQKRGSRKRHFEPLCIKGFKRVESLAARERGLKRRYRPNNGRHARRSLAARERGLKPIHFLVCLISSMSLAARERGLKRRAAAEAGANRPSLAARERGLKRTGLNKTYNPGKSLAARERGLKQPHEVVPGVDLPVARRTRAWIETAQPSRGRSRSSVARRTRAWIETFGGGHFGLGCHRRSPHASVD